MNLHGRNLALALLLLSLPLSLSACGGDAADGGKAGGRTGASVVKGIDLKGKNLLLVTIDTLRADHISPYGRKVETKALQLLADQGIVFDRATTPVPMTQPAHTSLFTGNYPGRHGVRDNVNFSLSESAVTLAEVLRDAGYQTGAVIASKIISKRAGLDQGFESYDDHFATEKLASSTPVVERRADEVRDATLGWLAARDRSKPFGLFVHFFDVHVPYEPPQAFLKRYKASPIDGETAFVDGNLGAILFQLEQEGQLDETLIVVLSDHGDSLGEHGEEEHGLFVYDSVMQVPLIIRIPVPLGPQGLRVATPVSLIDVMPTVLDLLGLEAPETDGVSLKPLLLGGEIRPRVLYAETQYPLFYRWSPSYSVRESERKYILAPRPELYDLNEDAGELENLVEEESALAEKMRLNLERQVALWAQGQGNAQQATSLSLQELAALGYGGGEAVDEALSGPLPDTKDRVQLYVMLADAMNLMAAERWAESSALFKKVLESDPTNPSALLNLGSILVSTGKLEEARVQLLAFLDIAPDNQQAKATLGMIYLRSQNLSEAEALFREILEKSPRSPEPRFFLGQVLAQRGEFEEALACFEIVREEQPGMPMLEASIEAAQRAQAQAQD